MKQLFLCAMCFLLCFSLSICRTDVANDTDEGKEISVTDAVAEYKTEEILAENADSKGITNSAAEQGVIKASLKIPDEQTESTSMEPVVTESAGSNNNTEVGGSQISATGNSVPSNEGATITFPDLIIEENLNSDVEMRTDIDIPKSVKLRDFLVA